MGEINHTTIKELKVIFVTFFVNLRYVYSGIWNDNIVSLCFTLIINILLFSTINYKRINKKILYISPFFIFFLLKNPSFNAICDFFILGYILDNVNKRKIILYNSYFIIFFLLCVWIGLKIGYIKDISFYVPKSDSIVYSLGFWQSNILSLYVYALVLSIYTLLRKNIWLDIILLYLGWKVYEYSGSRTCFIGTLILLICDITLLKLKMSFLYNKYALYSFPIILIIATFYFISHYSQYPIIDILFSGRLSIMGGVFETLSIKEYLIGFNIPPDTPIDSAYFTIFAYGGFPLILFHLYFYFKYIKKGNYKRNIPTVISILTAGMTEYVFVGLNMISIILLCIIIKDTTNDKNIFHTSRIQC